MRFWLILFLALVLSSPLAAEDIRCEGVLSQGGAVMCYGPAGTVLKKGKNSTQIDDQGRAIIGFDRDEALDEPITAILPGTETVTISLSLTARDYDISRIDGLPPSQVSTFTEEQLARIKSSSARKKVGFRSRVADIGFEDGFLYPVKDARKSSPFGAQRILNGEPKRPHYGVDIAAPIGTPIYAPADGVVSLSDDDLYFEGAMVMIDHGQGLNSMYLHVSEIFVEAGQSVKKGDKIAAIGSKGRSTGPHLCWRLKWRDRNLDPELLTEWPRHDD